MGALSLSLSGLPGPPGGVMVEETRDTSVKLVWTRGSEHGIPITQHVIQTRDYYALDPDDWKDAKTCESTRGGC